MKSRVMYSHLDKLWILRILLETESFKETAHRVGFTSSAISQTVTALEKLLGKSLIVREKGRVSATAYCTRLLQSVEPAFHALDSVEWMGEEAELAGHVKLTLGAYDSLAFNLLPLLIPAVAQKHPLLKISIKTGRSGALSSMLRKGDLDLALVIENDLIRNLEVLPLAEDGLGLYASPTHEIHRRNWVNLVDYRLASLSPGKDGHPLYYRRFIKSLGVNFYPSTECDSFETLRVLAVSKVSISVLPHRVARRNQGDLVQVLPASGRKIDSGLHRICLISRKGVDEFAKRLLFQELKRILSVSQG